MAFWIMRLIPATRNFAKTFAWVLRMIPSFSFGIGLINLSNKTLYSIVEGYPKKKDALDFDITGGDILYLGLEGVLYFLFTLLVERLSQIESVMKFFSDETSVKYVPK